MREVLVGFALGTVALQELVRDKAGKIIAVTEGVPGQYTVIWVEGVADWSGR